MSWFPVRSQGRRFTIRDDPELAAQFWVVFRATLARVEANLKPGTDRPQAHERVRELLDHSRQPSWDDAYEIEQLLALLYPDDAIRAEYQAKLLEARPILGEEQSRYYERQLWNDTNRAEDLRQLLGTMIRSVQWSYRLDEARRWWARRATNLFVFVTAVFGAMLAYIIVGFAAGDYSTAGWPVLTVAAAAGGWGASLSMISNLRSRLEGLQLRDLRMISAQTILLSRALIGVGAGLVLYLFLVGGVLAGNIFPDLSKTSLVIRDFALLVIWAVIGGFSEHFVPDLLERTAERARQDGRQDHAPAEPSRS